MTNSQPAAKYVSIASAAAYAGCSERFLRRCVAAGELESSLIGGRRFTTFAAIDRMMERNKNRRARKGRGIRREVRVDRKGATS